MTTETKHEAGRETDALLAERVMGFRWCRSQSTCHRALFQETARPDWFGYGDATGDEALARDWDCRLPAYSTDIAAAWTVVEARQPERWTRIIVGSKAVNGAGVVEYEPWADVEVGAYPTGQRGSRLLARESGPLADVPAMICRAHLAALDGAR